MSNLKFNDEENILAQKLIEHIQYGFKQGKDLSKKSCWYKCVGSV